MLNHGHLSVLSRVAASIYFPFGENCTNDLQSCATYIQIDKYTAQAVVILHWGVVFLAYECFQALPSGGIPNSAESTRAKYLN